MGTSAIAGPLRQATSYLAYVGARTTKARSARGDGINVFRVDRLTGAWRHLHHVVSGDNPSFLIMNRDATRLYTVHGDGSEVSAFSAAPNGDLEPLGSESTQGKNPAHLAIDPTGRWLTVANHYSSTVAVLPIRPDGGLRSVVDLVALEGPVGPRRDEQPYAKPHQTVFDPSGRFLAVPDKGLDRTFVFQLDSKSGKLSPADAPPAVALVGTGPRHIAFHPTRPLAYLLCELSSTVTAMRFDAATGRLAAFQIVPGVPDDWVSESRASEIEISQDGRFLYIANRGHGSIGAFAIDVRSGRLAPAGWSATGGMIPRFFALSPDGRFLFAANEDRDTITTFSVDRASGRLRRTAAPPTQVGSPVCIVFGPDRLDA
jgi:6-phosphogluconolactonase (cycloisomerase 2 family)